MMTTHKFQAGQTVEIVSRRFTTHTAGAFTVVRPLPSERGTENQYRIRSRADGQERVVGEYDLV
jgi:hypothetical protein